MSSAVLLAAETGHVENELPADPIVLGLIAFGVLVALLLITMSFKRSGD